MRILYDLFIILYSFTAQLLSVFGNRKARLWTNGRKFFPPELSNNNHSRIWFHCASLGEFEQGRPLIEMVKEKYPLTEIVLTFFSPSGYTIRKDYALASHVFYLPVDTSANANKFIQNIKPDVAIFIKYEFWYHYLNALKQNNIPVFIASAIFRKDQIFFRSYGNFFKKLLTIPTKIFVQNKESEKLLEEAGITNSIVTGDTRFDRVLKISKSYKTIDGIDDFISGYKILIGGSTWPEDETVLLEAMKILKNDKVKLIIAPHEVDDSNIRAILAKIKVAGFSDLTSVYSRGIDVSSRILLIDTVGILSSLYSKSDIAWIGGGFGKGIHNTLEAAVFGIPVLFGPNYSKFNEAKEMIQKHAAYSAIDKTEGIKLICDLIIDNETRTSSGESACAYINENVGATEKILNEIAATLKLV